MKVYVLTGEPYHDNSRVEGVFDSEKKAMDASPCGSWFEGGFYLERWGAKWSGYEKAEPDHLDDVTHLIYEMEVQ